MYIGKPICITHALPAITFALARSVSVRHRSLSRLPLRGAQLLDGCNGGLLLLGVPPLVSIDVSFSLYYPSRRSLLGKELCVILQIWMNGYGF